MEPRALVLTLRLPYPTRGGGDLRTWHVLRALRAAGGATVVGLAGDPTPPPGFDPGDWVRCPVARDVSGEDDLLGWLREPDGHPTDRWFTEDVAEGLRAVGDRVRPDVAVLETAFLHRYVPLLREELGLPVVLDAHNLEGPLA